MAPGVFDFPRFEFSNTQKQKKQIAINLLKFLTDFELHSVFAQKCDLADFPIFDFPPFDFPPFMFEHWKNRPTKKGKHSMGARRVGRSARKTHLGPEFAEAAAAC